jgi:hypothetical protein
LRRDPRERRRAVPEIEVFLLDDPEKGPYIQTEPSLAGVHSGDDVTWHFHSLLGPTVNWVEIEFTTPNSDFFESRHNPPEARCWAKLNGGHGLMYGTAPQLGGVPTTANAKYWVRAYTAEPVVAGSLKPFVFTDPNIIVCDP